MNLDRQRLVGYSILGGAFLTLISGLLPLRTLLGAVHYGAPVPWLIRMVVAPDIFPWRINWLGLGIDLVVWSMVVLGVLFLYFRRSLRSNARHPA